ncbi:ABC transporter permease [Saccharospirillum mangrovi]|uniref:ABC transporter permease n=1 Tax=Saccharospirillum mangrovi TaxID=2161747 RepID=UPI000D334481|nr:ABC transporter permease [Saccharospirillum mangrovi]
MTTFITTFITTWKLALRNLARNRRRTALTAMIISLSLAALVLTDGVIAAMGDTLVRSATRLYGGDAQVHQRGYLDARDEALTLQQPDEILQQLDQQTLVEAATPRALALGMVSSSANNRAVQVTGINAAREARVSKLESVIVAGQYLNDDGDETQILIGERLADLLEVELGDRLVLSLHNQRDQTAEQQLFRVSGVFRFDAREFDENSVFILLPRAQQMLGIGNSVHEVAFNLTEASLAGQADLPLFAQLSNDDRVAEGWPQLMPQLSGMLAMTNVSTIIVGVILFVLSALGVINGLFMSIYERTWEFGVLLAIGTRRRKLFALILAEGLLLGIGAIIVGLVLGVVITLWVAHVGIDYGGMEVAGVALNEMIRPGITASHLITLPLWVLALTLVACLYPAAHAARIVPATALHKSL